VAHLWIDPTPDGPGAIHCPVQPDPLQPDENLTSCKDSCSYRWWSRSQLPVAGRAAPPLGPSSGAQAARWVRDARFGLTTAAFPLPACSDLDFTLGTALAKIGGSTSAPVQRDGRGSLRLVPPWPGWEERWTTRASRWTPPEPAPPDQIRKPAVGPGS
jgi:hypothetical protein